MMMLVAIVITAGISMAQDPMQPQQKIQKRDRIHQQDHLLFQDGQLWQYQNGIRTQLQKQLQMKNGAVCNPDGTIQLKDKKQIQ